MEVVNTLIFAPILEKQELCIRSLVHAPPNKMASERKHRHLVETGLALLAHSSLPLRFWDEAFLTACYLINRLPTRVLSNSTPITKLLNITPDYSFLRTFGCACWPSLRKYNSHKLDFRSTMCVFLGYSPVHKGYKCLDRKTGRIYISRDVIFDENVFLFATPNSVSDLSQLIPSTTFPSHEPVTQGDPMRNYDMSLMHTDGPVYDNVPFQVDPTLGIAAENNVHSGPQSNALHDPVAHPIITNPPPVVGPQPPLSSPAQEDTNPTPITDQTDSLHPNPIITPPIEHIHTRSRSGIHQHKQFI